MGFGAKNLAVGGRGMMRNMERIDAKPNARIVPAAVAAVESLDVWSSAIRSHHLHDAIDTF